VPIAIIAEQRALQASIRQWAAGAGILATVRGLEPPSEYVTPDTHWADLAGLGVFSIAVPEQAGGAGGTVSDLAAALEQVTDALVPGPIMPTLLAELVLAAHTELPAVKELLPALAAGTASVAVALTAGTIGGTRLHDGALRVDGRVGPVLGAGATSHLLLAAATPAGEAWFLLEADHSGVRLSPRTPVDFSRPLGDITLTEVVVTTDRLIPGWPVDRVRDVAALLGAVEAAAVAGWCLRTATEYAKVRRQFGRPIGSFQAVKHICAGMLCRAEQAVATAWDAARAFDQAPHEFPLAAAAAATVALDAAIDNAKDCVQVLGGIGFTWEHDAHLYLRRALALRQLLGDGVMWRGRAAELALGGARRTLSAEPGLAGEAARSAVRTRIGEIAARPAPDHRGALADAGYLAPEWPAPYGIGASPVEQLIIDEELHAAGLVRPDLTIAGWAVPTILRHGTISQCERFAGPSLRGELTWCQLFSEPEAGSDLASLRTRAERADGGWRLSGQKVWTSLAGQADWGICLARTDVEAPKHRGLTYFLVDMHSPGIDIRPLREMTGRAVFNEVFLDDVFVPDNCVVGAPGEGWRLARGTLEFERVAMGRGSSLGDGVETLIETVRAAGLTEDQGVRDRLGALIADGLAVSLLDLRSTLRRLDGQRGSAESAVAKLVGVDHRQAVAEAALLLCGPDGATVDGASAEPVHQFLLTRCLSIAGGTTQILLNLVAERVLGLPREEVR
jgi:alkylation response protein AidB-like acyl-CoA dehydrogenase